MKILKMTKLLCLVLVSSLLFSLSVSAAEEVDAPTLDNWLDIHGMSEDEFNSLKDENGVVTIETPNTFADVVIDEKISLQDGGIYYNYVSDDAGAQGGFMAFGTTKVITGGARMLTLTLYNDDYPLFSTPGELVLNCSLYAFSCNLKVYYADGTHTSELYETDLTASVNQIVIPNPYANITKIAITQTNPVSSNNDLVISGGILSYYYEFYGDNVFDLISDFFSTFFDKLKYAFGDVDNADEFSDSINEMESLEEDLSGDAISTLYNYSFNNDSTSDSSLVATMVWLSSLLSLMFEFGEFQLLFWVQGSLFVAAVLLGFARFWRK